MPDVNLQSPFDAYDGENPYVFVSYAHKDAQMVYPEIKALHDSGVRIWFDGGIDPGNEWSDHIEGRLSKAHTFLVFITPSSVASNNVKDEISLALNEKKTFLAVYLQETQLPGGLRLRMSRIQAILKYNMTEENFRKKLLSSFSKVLIEEKRTTEIETELIPETFVRAINAVRVISGFLLKYVRAIEHSEKTEHKELATEIKRWLEFPNALGSEAQAAKLVAQVQIDCRTNSGDLEDVDRALNALDQRATERERQNS